MSRTYPIYPIEAAKAYETSVLEGDADRTNKAMEQAGRAVGQALLADYREIGEWPESARLLVLAGKGLNSGDAFIACETLFRALPQLRVQIVLTEPQDSLNPLARAALARLSSTLQDQLELVPVEDFLKAQLPAAEVVIDGLYGMGFRPPLREKAAELLRAINASTADWLKVAIDLPSGVGESTDPDAFRADFTYIPGVAKEPCFREDNLPFTGRIRFLEIPPFTDQEGPEQGPPLRIASPNAFKGRNRLRSARTDKRDFGHCLIVAGSRQMPGAAIMATLGALQAGAGLVTTFTPANISTSLVSAAPEAMWRPLPINPEGGLDVDSVRQVAQLAGKGGTLLVGPGLQMDRGTTFTLCRMIREIHLPLVIDASALTRDVVSAVLARPNTAGPVVLTPHAGEFERIHGMMEPVDPVRQVLLFSQKFRVITLLKGTPTLISDGREVIAAPVGGPVLARGGSGDILAGMLATLLAQSPGDPLGAAVDAATWHGAAADSLAQQSGATAVRTTELLPHLATTLRA